MVKPEFLTNILDKELKFFWGNALLKKDGFCHRTMEGSCKISNFLLVLTTLQQLPTAFTIHSTRNLYFPAILSNRFDQLITIKNTRLRGGAKSTEDSPVGEGDFVTNVSVTFLHRNVSDIQSYLPYLQEYQNPMVARAWPANTNFVGVTETVTDTVFRNSLRAESKGLVYREWIRAGPRKKTFFTPSEVTEYSSLRYLYLEIIFTGPTKRWDVKWFMNEV